jgi:hypothetical protein
MIKIKNIFTKKNIYNLGNNIQLIKKYNFSILINKNKNDLRLNNFPKMNFADKPEENFKNTPHSNDKKEEDENKEYAQNDKTDESNFLI